MRWILAPLIIAAGLVLVAVGLVVGCSLYMRHRCRAVGLGKPDWLFRDDERSREPMNRLPLWVRMLDAELKTREKEDR